MTAARNVFGKPINTSSYTPQTKKKKNKDLTYNRVFVSETIVNSA